MSTSSVYMVNFGFIDRDANTAQVTMYVPISVSVDDCFDFALQQMDNMLAISDAHINRLEMVWRYKIESLIEPAIDSNVRRGLLLFVQNEDDEISGIRIPSPKSEIFEQTGKYIGIRLDKTHSSVVQFQNLLLTQDFQTSDGRQLGDVLLTGGLAL